MDFELNYLTAITNDFSEDQKLGSGDTGDFYRAVHRGEEIAVKRFHQLQGSDDRSFVSECRILIEVNHPNVIQLIGYCHETRRKFVEHNGELVFTGELERLICYEYLQGGSLDKYIGDDSCELDWPTCYQIIKGTCEGLYHLHNDYEKPIYHQNLKPSNILLDANMTPKIAGIIGGSISSFTVKTTQTKGSRWYLPPEYRISGVITSKFDIFSLGVIIITMIAGEKGLTRVNDMAPKEFIDLVTENIKLPQASTSQVKKCVEIAIRCVKYDRRERPSIADIVHELGGRDAAAMTKTISQSPAMDQRKRVNFLDVLDGLIRNVSAEAIKLPLEVLCKITKNFADENKIGEGGFGIVYKGVLPTGNVVAVKKLLNTQTIEETIFQEEADFLMGFSHQNIVRFLGYCANTEFQAIKTGGSGSRQKHIFCEMRERLLCFEYLRNGGLDRHIKDELRGLEWNTRYKIIMGIVEGLQYLHNKGIVHLDLKPGNVLLDDFMVPKITDFGTSRDLDGRSHFVTKHRAGSRGYFAPEYFLEGDVSPKADIFSLGAMIREIVTGRKQDTDNKNVLRRWRHRWNKSGKYPPLGYQQISKCIEIARMCVVVDPKLRPDISDIINAQNEVEKADEHTVNADESTTGKISPYPWELLEIDPLELIFPFKPNKLIQSSVELHNERDDYIAFDIQKPRNTLAYFIDPSKGIIPPHSRRSVTVTFQASQRPPEYDLRKDNFMVRCAIVDDGLTAANVSNDLFNTKLGKVDKVMLTVSFTAS